MSNVAAAAGVQRPQPCRHAVDQFADLLRSRSARRCTSGALEIDPDGRQRPRGGRSDARAEHPASRRAGAGVDQIRHRIAREAVHDKRRTCRLRCGCARCSRRTLATRAASGSRRSQVDCTCTAVSVTAARRGLLRPAEQRGLRPAASRRRRDARSRTPRCRLVSLAFGAATCDSRRHDPAATRPSRSVSGPLTRALPSCHWCTRSTAGARLVAVRHERRGRQRSLDRAEPVRCRAAAAPASSTAPGRCRRSPSRRSRSSLAPTTTASATTAAFRRRADR